MGLVFMIAPSDNRWLHLLSVKFEIDHWRKAIVMGLR